MNRQILFITFFTALLVLGFGTLRAASPKKFVVTKDAQALTVATNAFVALGGTEGLLGYQGWRKRT